MRSNPSTSAVLVVALAAAASVTTCGGTSPSACVPGQSIGCVGPGSCQGFQVCNAAGDGYSVCDCTVPNTGVDGSIDATPSLDASGDALVDSPADEGTPEAGDAESWTPALLPNLSLWLDDTVGFVPDLQKPGHIAAWLDQSGKGNDAHSTDLVYTPTVDTAAIKGRDAVRADGTLVIVDSPSLQFGIGDFAIVLVARLSRNLTINPGALYRKSYNTLFIGIDSTSYTARFTDGMKSATFDFTAANNKFATIFARGPNVSLDVAMNTSTGGLSTDDVSAVGQSIYLLESGGTTAMELAEVIAIKGTLSATDTNHLKAYFKVKFGL